MELNEADNASAAPKICPFCTCSKWPESVKHIEPPAAAATDDSTRPSRSEGTYQVAQHEAGETATPNDDTNESAPCDDIEAPMADPVGSTRPARSEGSYQVAQLEAVGAATPNDEADESTPRDAVEAAMADPVDLTLRPRPYCTCQVARDEDTDADVPDAQADDAIEDSVEMPFDPTRPPRPYCTCQIPQPDDAAAPDIPTGEVTPSGEVEATEAQAEPASDEIVVPLIVVQPTPSPAVDQGETDLARLETRDAEITLTDRRVVMQGNADSHTPWASMSLKDVTGARIDKPQRGYRGWIWTAVGAAATIAIWQILDGGGWIRLAFPGLVALSTVVMLFTTMLAPLPLIFSVVGRDGNSIESRISSDQQDAAGAFGRQVIEQAQASAARASDGANLRRSPDPQ